MIDDEKVKATSEYEYVLDPSAKKEADDPEGQAVADEVKMPEEETAVKASKPADEEGTQDQAGEGAEPEDGKEGAAKEQDQVSDDTPAGIQDDADMPRGADVLTKEAEEEVIQKAIEERFSDGAKFLDDLIDNVDTGEEPDE